MLASVAPGRVRYIKLGEAGGWEKECLEKGIIRIGFGSADPERFAVCAQGPLDAYIDFVHRFGHRVDVYASLDSGKTWQQNDKKLRKMRERGLDPLPVFRWGEPFAHLKRLAESRDYT